MAQSRDIVIFWIDEAPRQDFAERMANAGTCKVIPPRTLSDKNFEQFKQLYLY